MKTPHKHAAIIKAWADGALIQERFKGDGKWHSFDDIWMDDDEWEYRIKPEPTPDVVRLLMAELHHGCTSIYMTNTLTNLKLTFDGETGKLKAAEVLA